MFKWYIEECWKEKPNYYKCNCQLKNETERLVYNLSCNSISLGVQRQIRTSRLIETLGFLFYISVSKKPFAYAIFRTIRVKVLLYVSNLLSSTAPFLWLFRLEISVMPKKWNRKIWPRPFVSFVWPIVSTVWLFV